MLLATPPCPSSWKKGTVTKIKSAIAYVNCESRRRISTYAARATTNHCPIDVLYAAETATTAINMYWTTKRRLARSDLPYGNFTTNSFEWSRSVTSRGESVLGFSSCVTLGADGLEGNTGLKVWPENVCCRRCVGWIETSRVRVAFNGLFCTYTSFKNGPRLMPSIDLTTCGVCFWSTIV